MQEQLDTFTQAYTKNFSFQFDNEIMLNWYPKRIMKMTTPNCNVLELGVGHGYSTNLFASNYKKHSVIEASPAIIAEYHRKFPNSSAQIIESYFEKFQPSEQYDLIVMGFVLEHVDSPLELLKQYRNFLQADGKCFITVPNAESLHRRFGQAAGLLDNIMTLGTGDLALGHKRLYTTEILTSQLEEIGYSIIRREGIFLKPLTTEQLQKASLSPEIINGMCTVGIDYPELSAGLLFEVKKS